MSASSLYYAHAILCLLVAALLVWQAFRRPTLDRRMLYLVAGLVAAASLWLMAYPPQRTITVEAPDAAVLLTDGYQPDSLRRLVRQLGPVRVLRYAPNAPATAGRDTTQLRSLSLLPEQLPQLRRLHVLGRGLAPADVAVLSPTIRVVSHRQLVTAGFTAATWPSTLPLGDFLRVEGSFFSAKQQATWLYLLVAGAPRDSVRLPTGRGSFALRYRPQATGRMVAQLAARQDGRLIVQEPVPAVVQPTKPLHVLVLGGGPSFELNLLKNQLGTRGHSVALRVNVSRGLTQTDFVNETPRGLNRLTLELLARYDVLIADADALSTLSVAEARTLTRSTADGLGLVLLASDATLPRTLPAREAFSLRPRPTSTTERPAQLTWPDGSAATLLPATLVSTTRLQPLVTGPITTEVAAASTRYGWGHVVVATPAQTYRWLLSGATATYDDYWSRLLTAAARPAAPANRWTTTPWPHPHQPAMLRLESGTIPQQRAVVQAPSRATSSVALQQSVGLSTQAEATFWPTTSGWHTVQLPGQVPTDFYVYASTNWIAPAAAASSLAVQLRPTQTLAKAEPQQRREPIPVGWFFTAFVLATGLLWLDDKR